MNENHPKPNPTPKGFIAFCETKLRYEKGFKAWITLGPYLVGALVLEKTVAEHGEATSSLASWMGFLAYLILFPLMWQRILKLIALKITTPVRTFRPTLPINTNGED